MKKRYYFIIGLILSLLIIYIYFSSVKLSPETREFSECNSLYYAEKGKLNIVFFSSMDITKSYADYLLSIPPFDEYANEINFFYIDDYSPVCETYHGIALFCHSKELVRKASVCPSDYIVVPKSEETEMRSSAYMNVLSINTNSPISVFAHEFGHALASLDEEYISSKPSFYSKNCKDSCNEFSKGNCFTGCSDNAHFRSAENGLMRTLYSNSYGEFDENIIRNEIRDYDSLITSNVVNDITNCNEEEYYLIGINYALEKPYLESKSLERGCVGSNGNGEYSFSIEGGNSVAINYEFNPELIFTDNQEEGEETIKGEVYNFEGISYIKIPNLIGIKNVIIYDENKNEVLKIPFVSEGERACRIL